MVFLSSLSQAHKQNVVATEIEETHKWVNKGTKRLVFVMKAGLVPNDHEDNKTSTRPLYRA